MWKRVFFGTLLLIVCSTFFLSSYAQVSAQGSGPAGGIPGVDRPWRPTDPGYPGPRPTTPTTPTDDTGTGEVGRGDAGPGGPMTEAERQAAAESAMAAQNLGSAPDGVLGFLYSYALSGLGWLVGIAGSAFDYAIENFIIGFGNLYITGTGETIDALWGTVRDIFNLTFIFGLVYIGFKMILDSSDSSARKMLVSLIAAALLVNFSLFITKFVIDFSNIAATQVWNAFEGRDLSGRAVDTSITGGFMTMLGVNSMIEYMYVGGGSFTYVFGIIIIFSILAYVFLAGAVMIIIRFVVLNIYMVFSPFMFLGWVFPALAGYSRDYWSGFLRQAFFAPAFIFMLYLSYMVASTFPVQRNLDRIFNPNVSTVSEYADTIPYFAMVVVFLLASMVVAKKMGAHGSTMAVSIGKNLSGRARNAVTYAPRAVTRMGINKAGESAEKRLNSLQTRGGALGWIARTNTVDRAVRGTAQSASKARLGTVGSNKEQREYAAGIRSRANQTAADNDRVLALKQAETTLSQTSSTADELNTAFESLGKTIKDMTNDQREDLGFDKLKSTQVAAHLSDAHIETLEKSGKFSKQQIADIKSARSTAFKNLTSSGHTLSGPGIPAAALTSGVANKQREALMNRSIQDIGKMPVEVFTKAPMAQYITPQMLQEKMKNGGVSSSQLAEIKRNIEDNIIHTTSPNNTAIKMWRNWSDNTVYGAQLGINFA